MHWQGRIAAQLGQCERAVGFLRDALGKGHSVYQGKHAEAPELVKLRSCPVFRQLMEPKG